jgi:hypothetical protein
MSNYAVEPNRAVLDTDLESPKRAASASLLFRYDSVFDPGVCRSRNDVFVD